MLPQSPIRSGSRIVFVSPQAFLVSFWKRLVVDSLYRFGVSFSTGSGYWAEWLKHQPSFGGFSIRRNRHAASHFGGGAPVFGENHPGPDLIGPMGLPRGFRRPGFRSAALEPGVHLGRNPRRDRERWYSLAQECGASVGLRVLRVDLAELERRQREAFRQGNRHPLTPLLLRTLYEQFSWPDPREPTE